MTEPISAVGVDVLIAREGCELTAYQDSQGYWTIGVGHLSPPPEVYPGMTITQEEAEEIFQNDLEKYIKAVDDFIVPKMLVNERDAFVSTAFNIGISGFQSSTFAKRYNAGDKAGCAEAYLWWDQPPEIIPRRKAEQEQFLTPYDVSLPYARTSDANPIPPPEGWGEPEKPARPGKPGRPGKPEPEAPPAPLPCPHPGPAFQPWQIGALQARLAYMGFNQVGAADGIWGPKTTEGIAVFQASVGIVADYGHLTAAALADEKNRKKPAKYIP